ncbi:hypothetical protein [Haliscomenobacter sp.]|uniref:hypothetical protein n=1 Tax=Haliscomenobacter sp. TaxID=2717303 RepID=UPI00359304D0
MDYEIQRPVLLFNDQRLWVLADEISNLTLDQLKSILEDFENIFNGKYSASSFGYHVSMVSFDDQIAKLEYHDEMIMELKSKELYQVLADWYDKLSKWTLLIN